MDTTDLKNQNQQNAIQPTNDAGQQPVNPSGSIYKEAAPLTGSVEAPTQDFLSPAEKEPQIHPEVKEAGVEVVEEKPNLPTDVKKAGVELAKESVPVETEPTGALTLPMSGQQATQTIKINKKDKKKSIVWFATIILRLLKKQQAKHVKGEDIIGG